MAFTVDELDYNLETEELDYDMPTFALDRRLCRLKTIEGAPRRVG